MQVFRHRAFFFFFCTSPALAAPLLLWPASGGGRSLAGQMAMEQLRYPRQMVHGQVVSVFHDMLQHLHLQQQQQQGAGGAPEEQLPLIFVGADWPCGVLPLWLQMPMGRIDLLLLPRRAQRCALLLRPPFPAAETFSATRDHEAMRCQRLASIATNNQEARLAVCP